LKQLQRAQAPLLHHSLVDQDIARSLLLEELFVVAVLC
jgi:hypothetical protein